MLIQLALESRRGAFIPDSVLADTDPLLELLDHLRALRATPRVTPAIRTDPVTELRVLVGLVRDRTVHRGGPQVLLERAVRLRAKATINGQLAGLQAAVQKALEKHRGLRQHPDSNVHLLGPLRGRRLRGGLNEGDDSHTGARHLIHRVEEGKVVDRALRRGTVL